MGKLKYFEVRFNNRSRIYHAGENLGGAVMVDLKETAQIQGIDVCVYGKPCVRCVYGTGPGCCSTVFSEAKLIAEKVTIFPYDNSGCEAELGAGFHTFNFNIPLPASIPSSFECKYSKVQYYVVAEMEVAGGKSLRERTKASFKVINSLDLLTLPHTQVSQQQQARVALAGTPLSARSQGGYLDVIFHTDKAGYIPGEKVKIYGKINNGTSVQMRKSYVELVQVISLRTNGKTKTVRNPVTGLRHHSIPSGETDVWDTDCLTIPELPPTSLDINTGSISVTYYLQLVVIPGGLNQKIKLPIEVIIGTGLGITPPQGTEINTRLLSHYRPSADRLSAPLRELPQDQFDIINTDGGRVSLEIVTPPPYVAYDEPPPPYQETWESQS